MTKMILTATAIALVGLSANATVDGHDKIFLVVKNIQSEEYFVERAPIIGCYGLAKGPQLAAFTAEYKVPSNIGCGSQRFDDNINALTCAQVVSSEESADFMAFSEVVLDISKCADKASADFTSTVEKAAKLNFAPKTGSFKLVLKK